MSRDDTASPPTECRCYRGTAVLSPGTHFAGCPFATPLNEVIAAGPAPSSSPDPETLASFERLERAHSAELDYQIQVVALMDRVYEEYRARVAELEDRVAELEAALKRRASEGSYVWSDRGELLASREYVEGLQSALRLIRSDHGRVCAEFEICEHESCADSSAAWMIASEALRSDWHDRHQPPSPHMGQAFATHDGIPSHAHVVAGRVDYEQPTRRRYDPGPGREWERGSNMKDMG